MYREIAAKTLIGKGKLPYMYEKKLNLGDNVSKLLGCWIIDLKHECKIENRRINLVGTYSIQLWYALDNDQKSSVYEERISFDEEISMSYRDLDTLDDKMYVKVYISKYPTCIGMNMSPDKEISLNIAGEFFLDAFQEAILVVNCSLTNKDELTLEEEIMMNVNPNYLMDKKK